MARPHLSIVIPAFNEKARIVATLEQVLGYLSGQPYTWEVVMVDDGSTDGTGGLARGYARENDGVRVESIPHAGKGWAMKHGMLAAAGEYRFACDADLAMPIDQVAAFLQRMEQGWDIVIGSRQIAGARRFGEPAIRHILGRVFNWSVRALTVGGFQDTQCGFKCFRADAAERLFRLQRTRGFGFDVEILYVAAKHGLRVLEMPIDWYHRGESKVRPGLDPFLMLRDSVLVRWHDLRGRYRTPAGPESVALSSRARVAVERGEEPLSPAPPLGERVVAVVVPTYNEADNLPRLAERLFALGIPNIQLIVVDDASPDGTARVAAELSDRFDGRVTVVQRQSKQGLGTAYVAGFSRALAIGADYVVEMDADLSHGPEYIPRFLEALERADVVVGSRYVPGGGVDASWSLGRRLLSYFANLGIRMAAGVRVRDATSGFKGFRGEALRSLDLDRFKCKGFGFQTEVARACQLQGHRVVEYPIVFVERERGKSKMSLFIVFEALWRLLLLRWRR